MAHCRNADTKGMDTFRNGLAVLFWALASIVFFSCQPKLQERGNGPLKILATTGMIADAALAIGGNKVEVTTLMGPGVDPHLYKASLRDLNKLTSADLILYNGLHLEGKMATLFEKLEKHKKVVAVSSGVNPDLLHKTNSFGGNYDPHIWFSVPIWMQAVNEVKNALIQSDSGNAAFYIQRAAIYQDSLHKLDIEIREALLAIPNNRRVLITAHDAFGYFGQTYNVEVKGLQGLSTVSEYGLRDVSDLVNFIQARKIKAIFAETSVSPKALEAVVAGCAAKGWKITLGSALYSDAMGPKGSPEGTYIGMLRANVKHIVTALK